MTIGTSSPSHRAVVEQSETAAHRRSGEQPKQMLKGV